jgi:hypothetical protein
LRFKFGDDCSKFPTLFKAQRVILKTQKDFFLKKIVQIYMNIANFIVYASCIPSDGRFLPYRKAAGEGREQKTDSLQRNTSEEPVSQLACRSTKEAAKLAI